MNNTPSILIGNSFPLSLIRRPVRIKPASLDELKREAAGKLIVSFWGHENSRAAAEAFCGLPLRPETARPALRLDAGGFPAIGSRSFRSCWVLSPDYVEPVRPALGAEVPAENICGWNILKLTWE